MAEIAAPAKRPGVRNDAGQRPEFHVPGSKLDSRFVIASHVLCDAISWATSGSCCFA
ncbi:hypothetical protein MUP29_06025 [bacterium]|nr:hypothetical protein [bacterium]